MISVVITTYNYQKYIERAIRSVLDQSLPKNEYEIIVVNDASTDNTKKILENYKDNVRIFNLEKNVGLAAARNIGIKKATGQFVVFLDADDYVHRDLLLIQSTFLFLNKSLDAVSADYFLVNELGEHLEHVNSEKKPIACGIMFRKDYLYDVGLYDESFRMREEEDLRMRFQKKYKIYNIIIPLYRYRMHDCNLTKNCVEMKKYARKINKKYKTKIAK
jgi:glycosyltransferase involved in cell wall biosynthesis